MWKWARANLGNLGVFKLFGMINLILEYLRYFSAASGVNLQRREWEACKKTNSVNILRKEEWGGVGELEIYQLNLDFWKSTQTNNPTTFFKHLEDKNNMPNISSKPSNFIVHHGNGKVLQIAKQL